MAPQWEQSQHTSFTLWDIDREFQNAFQAYEQWQARHRRRRPVWACFRKKHQDALGKALTLGPQAQQLMEAGKALFGTRFEQGDSQCHTILSAQLLRLQCEVKQPIFDSALSPAGSSLPSEDLISTAKSIRRTCLSTLREQHARFESKTIAPFLPPPRFRVEFCPFADQLRKDLKEKKASTLRTRKVKSADRYDDREICPHCCACISVTTHSGLPEHRGILFMSHIPRNPYAPTDKATFACNSCNKTFEDSYGFLDHMFQKEIGSDRSCLKRTVSGRWIINQDFMQSDPSIVEQCLKNCLMRELTRARTKRNTKSQIFVREIDPIHV